MNDISATLRKLASSRDLHAKFVNTLSLLEYIGARKILKSQKESRITSELLSHVAEEIRHAQALKRVALKLSEGRLEGYSQDELLAGSEARAYIQAVDHTELLPGEKPRDAWIAYLYTTLLIEERANKIYPLYEPILAEAGHPGVLRAILREEESHLNDIRASLERCSRDAGPLEGALDLEPLRGQEESAFRAWWSAVERMASAT